MDVQIPRRVEKTDSNRYAHAHVPDRAVCISQKVETTKVSIRGCVIKKIWYIHTMEQDSALKRRKFWHGLQHG